jgi:hypothetical protein
MPENTETNKSLEGMTLVWRCPLLILDIICFLIDDELSIFLYNNGQWDWLTIAYNFSRQWPRRNGEFYEEDL